MNGHLEHLPEIKPEIHRELSEEIKTTRTFYARPENSYFGAWSLNLTLVNKRGIFEAPVGIPLYLTRGTILALTINPTDRRILKIQHMHGFNCPGPVLMERSAEDLTAPKLKIRGYWKNPFKPRSSSRVRGGFKTFRPL